MLRLLKSEPGWHSEGFPLFQRCFESGDKTEICVAVYDGKDYTDNVDRDGFMEMITVHKS